MTISDFLDLETRTVISDEQKNEQEAGRLEFSLSQKARSSVIPESTQERVITVAESALNDASHDRLLYKEVDDKFVQWIGRVLEINGETFTARIDPVWQRSTSKIARFNVKKVVLLNEEQMAEGATFYWTVGLFRNPKGSYERKSEVRFRLPIIPNRQAVDELARIKAQSLFDGIGWLE